jgi:heme/copper-type cytochrome/quinol oxidase subunit 2
MKKAFYNQALSNWELVFHNPATPVMEGAITLHNYIIMYLICVVVVVVWFIVRGFFFLYESKKSNFSDLNCDLLFESVWTVAPAFILVTVAMPAFSLLYSMEEIVDPSLTIKIIGNEWHWSYELEVGSGVSKYSPLNGSPKFLLSGPGYLDFLHAKTKIYVAFAGKNIAQQNSGGNSLLLKVTRSLGDYIKVSRQKNMLTFNDKLVVKKITEFKDASQYSENFQKYIIAPVEKFHYKGTSMNCEKVKVSCRLLGHISETIAYKYKVPAQVVANNLYVSKQYVTQFGLKGTITTYNVPGPLGNSQPANDFWIQVDSSTGKTLVVAEMKSTRRGTLLNAQVEGLQGLLQKTALEQFLNQLRFENFKSLFDSNDFTGSVVKKSLPWFYGQPVVIDEIARLQAQSGLSEPEANYSVAIKWSKLQNELLKNQQFLFEVNAIASTNSPTTDELENQLIGDGKLTGINTLTIIHYTDK